MTPSRDMSASTIPEGRSLFLPPISTSANIKDGSPSDSAQPVVFAVKLTQEMVSTLVAGAATDDASIHLAESHAVLNMPNHDSFKFTLRPIGEGDDSRRAVCYSRNATDLRAVGPIVADLDLERANSVEASSVAKMRAADERDKSQKRGMKRADDIAPTARKKRRTVEKRPRPPPKMPKSSPIVSPGRGPSANNTPPRARPNGRSRATPTASAAVPPSSAPRRISPQTNSQLSGLFGNGNRPEMTERVRPGASSIRRSVTPPKLRSSPYGSRRTSPLPSSAHSPSSPKTGNLRAKSEDIDELRVNVMHILASQPRAFHSLSSRVIENDAPPELKEDLKSVLQGVATCKDGIYTLRGHCWARISEDYQAYTHAERTQMRIARSEYYSANGTNDVKSITDGVMTDAQLDSEIRSFQKAKTDDNVGKISSERGEKEFRKTFEKWYPLYAEVINRLEKMSKTFKSLDSRYRERRSAEERDSIVKKITAAYEKHKKRREELITVLPLLHEHLRSIRSALDKWAKDAMMDMD